MSEIPLELCREILSLLPAEPLLRFRCVCKSWRETIDDPIFIRLHLDRQLLNARDSSNGVGRLILRGDLDNRFYSLPIDSVNSDTVKPTLLKHTPTHEWTNSPLSSCNGVILISYSKRNYLLWNPLTRDLHNLPPVTTMSKKTRGLYHSVSGLGYDSASNDFKVVKIAQIFDPRDRSLKSETMLYSLKSGSWRKINDFPYRISRLSGAVFLEGALHWISGTLPLKHTDDLIVGLDLSTGEYRLLPLPFDVYGYEKPLAKHLSALGGCLILCCCSRVERLDVWSMEDYGLENSWVKLFSVGVSDFVGLVVTLRPIAYSKRRGEVLLQHDKKEFVWFDLETKLVKKKIRIHRQPTMFSSLFSVASLVRLNSR
ncbi:hypothetical protein ABFS82_10G120400 [Erythranthe guttata]|uniref:F-box protein CPR30-like n=1 Tax=Erythranthe guttata TaxID=4155 RepID=UPI00064DD65B|nr:PREDICTED: F-box protein CPR30-like [Erythranthe guttata]|eukprot:XP_012851876.1 PREDICTED: F-box protein CPR30-like [Erythranthe guttata]